MTPSCDKKEINCFRMGQRKLGGPRQDGKKGARRLLAETKGASSAASGCGVDMSQLKVAGRGSRIQRFGVSR